MLAKAIAFASVAACGGPNHIPATLDALDVRMRDASGWVELRISRVQVAPTRIDRTTWDRDQEASARPCGLIAMLGEAVAPGGGVLTSFLCEMVGRSQEQRDPKEPDLVAIVHVGTMIYRTSVATDSFAAAFDYRLVVPWKAIPPTGLEIQIVDQDDDVGSGELIGLVRIGEREIRGALGSANAIAKSDGPLQRIEVIVTPYVPPARIEPIAFDTRREFAATKAVARAGELVRIRARGSYSVTDDHAPINVRGYANGEKSRYNLDEFPSANHAAAIAMIGAPTETRVALLVDACVALPATNSGAIYIGINDDDRENNDGIVEFEVVVAPPTVEEFTTGTSHECDIVIIDD